jgi:glucose dehydrogenase
MASPPRDPDTDVVVVGSGIAGSLCAHALCRAGLKVIMLEAGPRLNRDDLVQRYRGAVEKDYMSPFPNVAHGPEAIIQQGPHPHGFRYVRAVLEHTHEPGQKGGDKLTISGVAEEL